MRMLVDHHRFVYVAAVPWPHWEDQMDWEIGIREIQIWLTGNVGPWMQRWAWSDSQSSSQIGVAFRWDPDRTLFVLTWG